ncbi:MAG: aspartyl-phosphate phosphatase Spo0E family protein [Paenibacillaceae bacterium]
MGLAKKLKVGSCREFHTNREQDLGSHWFNRRTKFATPDQILEDEIYFLRRRMEQMYSQEQSLTSEFVIELSNLLDHKINEYMSKVSRNR